MSFAGATAPRRRERAPDDLGALLAGARARLGIIVLLVALATLAWWSTAVRMRGMDAGPGTDLGGFGWFIGVWVVMMAAMMFPSVAPTVALYSRMTRQRGPWLSLLFAGGYLVVWTAAGVAAYGLYRLGRAALGGSLGWHGGGRWLAGAVLLGAAAYELTPLKDVCLSKCRSPLGFLLGDWRPGTRGAVEMGARHGAWCLGCCWALMAALFALGVMSLLWMAVVSGLIALEKTVPRHRAATFATTAILSALAIGVLVSPSDVPGLVIPGGQGAMRAMHAMGAGP
jgi:predicted metal-binding membrane protein